MVGPNLLLVGLSILTVLLNGSGNKDVKQRE